MTESGLPEAEGSITIEINKGAPSMVPTHFHARRRSAYGATRSGLFLAAALCLGALDRPAPGPPKAGHEPQQQPDVKQDKPATDQRGTKATPLIVEIPRTADDEREAQRRAQSEKDGSTREGLLVWFTGVLTAATAILAFFTWRLIVVGRDQHRASLEAMKLARESSEKELRAYIAVVPMGVTKLIGRDEAIGQVELRNVGKLPAHQVFLWVNMAIGDRGRTDFSPTPDDSPHRTVQPGATLYQGSKSYIPIAEICDSSKHVFVWGEAHYDDGYGVRRFTRFCHRYHIASRRAVPTKRAGTETRYILDADKARYHTDGNDAD